jgi:integrase
MKLTVVKIKNAAPGDRAYSLSDGHGLHLRVEPNGSKLWRWNYRFEGKQKTMALGIYPQVSLAEVRERHTEERKTLASGVDPMAKKKADRQAQQELHESSFRSVADKWMAHWRVGITDRHAEMTRRRLEANVYPELGNRPIMEIESPELVAMVKKIESRGVGDMAKRALETTGQIFRYAIAHGYATRNPAADIKPRDVLKATSKANLARVEAKELPDLLRKIELYQGTHVTRMAMKLMAHTFVRTGELIGAEWSEIDLEHKRWDIPKERMKMRTPHIVTLSRQVVEILTLLRHLTGKGRLLFPGEYNPNKPISNNTILKALERMGYKYRMTGHGFRGLASTILHEHGFDHQHIELQLAHAPRNAVSAAYNHALYLAPRAKMMQWWSEYLEKQQKL